MSIEILNAQKTDKYQQKNNSHSAPMPVGVQVQFIRVQYHQQALFTPVYSHKCTEAEQALINAKLLD